MPAIPGTSIPMCATNPVIFFEATKNQSLCFCFFRYQIVHTDYEILSLTTQMFFNIHF